MQFCPKKMQTPFNRYVYIAFILIGLYFMAILHKPMDSVIYFGLALVFDPFDTKQKWDDRPMWQRTVLIIHLVAILALIAWEMFR